MEKKTMGEIMKGVQDQHSSKGLNPDGATLVLRNPIIPKKKAQEWDETFTRLENKIDGIIIDSDSEEQRLTGIAESIEGLSARVEGVAATKILLSEQVRTLTRQLVVRDVIMIMLVVVILLVICFNTAQLWNWN